jgi:hypothetical protein
MTLPKPPLRRHHRRHQRDAGDEGNTIENLGVLTASELFRAQYFRQEFQPSNYNKADGSPLRLFGLRR